MGRSPTGPEDFGRLIAIIALVVATSRKLRKGEYWWIIVLTLLFRGYYVFALFFFVRSERLAFYDGTNWWSTVHHPYFRVCVTMIVYSCFQKLAAVIRRLYRPPWFTAFAVFVYSVLMWWSFYELCTVPLYVSHDHIYLWVYAGLSGSANSIMLAFLIWKRCSRKASLE